MDHTRRTVFVMALWQNTSTVIIAFTVSRSDQGVRELSISRSSNPSPDVTLYSAE